MLSGCGGASPPPAVQVDEELVYRYLDALTQPFSYQTFSDDYEFVKEHSTGNALKDAEAIYTELSLPPEDDAEATWDLQATPDIAHEQLLASRTADGLKISAVTSYQGVAQKLTCYWSTVWDEKTMQCRQVTLYWG